ncbi:hypothetical protein IVB18_18225 [Bradyrhizobium sp. 186]|uniref:hypothetical protein n=1 Tax=Bradyrhizobium sp. 186 TaxID=2782654 RepID=UPI0020010BD9|nr:hypothetical protein [Bradyrhizobium sp. 186]UPK38997.1 hypothetical protein IVB18_18225 [Bradyrhizobium sp. 186]
MRSELENAVKGAENFGIRDIANCDQVGLQARGLDAACEAAFDINMRVHVFGFEGIGQMVEAGFAILPQGAVLPLSR